MDKYDVVKSCRLIKDFVEELSLWYVRRSRERFKNDGKDRNQASATLKLVLSDFAKMVAPILPFTSEFVFQKIGEKESVHMSDWPKQNKKIVDAVLEEKIDEVRKFVSLALAERTARSIKVKQPLASLYIKNTKSKLKGEDDLLKLIKDEVNIKEIIFSDKIEQEVEFDLKITEELKEEGILRNIIRAVQTERKAQKLVPQDRVLVYILTSKEEKILIEKNKELLLKEFRATEIFVEEQEAGFEIKIKKTL
jgi:isoleucyl-tRNA synthetase